MIIEQHFDMVLIKYDDRRILLLCTFTALNDTFHPELQFLYVTESEFEFEQLEPPAPGPTHFSSLIS